MKRQEKLVFLRNFKEDRLTANVIRPLLEEMGFKNITVTHKANEKGIDLIFFKENEFEEREYTGVQVKAVKIHGSVGKKGNATEIMSQAKQAFSHTFHDVYDNKPKNIDRFIVMTSKEITPEARESVREELGMEGYKKTIQFFDGNKLVDLVNKWMPDFFWEEYDYFNRYFKAMKADFEKIKDISAIGQKEPVHLEDIYVSLKLSEESRERHMAEMPEEMAEKIFDEKIMEVMEKERERKVERRRVIDPDTAIKQFQRMVILGAPGAGKTTLLKHLALKCCKENMEQQERLYVPVPITLREFFETGKELREYIDAVFEKYGFPEAKKFVDKELKSGKCILLLDGFDELAARENQEKVSKEIHTFVEQYHNCKVLVTSRIAGYHGELSGFTRTEVMEFDKDQIKRFIHNWFGEAHKNKAQSMLKTVMEYENIREMARNPLMIAIIAIIYEEDRELPQRRADLYKRAVDVLLSKWDVQRKIKNHFKADKKAFILKKLAYQCHCRNRRIIKEEEILKEIEQYSSKIGLKKGEAKSLLEEIWQRSYLLRQIAMDTYDFLHLSFQEYFTALELKEQEDGIGTIIKHISEPWWEEPILLFTGISKDAGPLIKRIQKEVPEDIFYSNLMLAGQCIADAEFTDAALKDEIVEKIWTIYESKEFPLLRDRAENVFRQAKPRSIIDRLIKQLTDKDSDLVWRAASALGAIGSEAAIPPLIQALTEDRDRYVRWRAANALGAIGRDAAIAPLIQALTKDQDSSVRGSAADALGAIGSDATIPPLIPALTKDKDRDVRRRAASALGAIGSEVAIPPLIQALTKDKDRYVRWRAASALGAIASEAAIPPLIQALTEDKDRYVRWRAADALGAIGSKAAIPSLIQVLIEDKDRYVRGSTASALGGIASEAAIPQLIRALTRDKDSEVRGSAASALGAIASETAIPPLIQALTEDKIRSIRWRATSALGAIGSDTAIPQLIQTLTEDKDSYVRGSAAYALGVIGSDAAIAPLIQALTEDKDSSVRVNAASALGTIGNDAIIPQLILTLTKDKGRDVRRRAAYALGKIGNYTASQPLKKALKDKNEDVRTAAFEALEKISRRLGVRIAKD